MSAFSEVLHPRDAAGRFAKKAFKDLLKGKGSISARVSTRSASVSVGKTFPVIPGRVNGYIGVLGRIERDRSHETVIEKAVNRSIDKATNKINNDKIRKIVKDLTGSKSGIDIGDTKIVVARPRVRKAQISSRKRLGGNTITTPRNRKPRTRRA